jgi:uncharacterized repeat protein (TIGR01451 family)
VQTKSNNVTLTYTGQTGSAIQDSVSIDYAEPDLVITKAFSPDTGLDAGDTVTIILMVANNGTSPAYDITLTDTLNSGGELLFDLISIVEGTTPPRFAYSYANPTVSWEMTSGSLAAGAQGTFQFTGEVRGSVVTGSSFANSAAVSGNSQAGVVAEERTTTDTGSDTVITASPTITQALKSGSASWTSDTAPIEIAIGEVLTYQVAATLPEGVTQADGVTASIISILPVGFAYITDTATIQAVADNGLNGSIYGAISTSAQPFTPTLSGQDLEFDLGTLTNSDNDGGAEQIIFEYSLLVLNTADNNRSNSKVNTIALNFLNKDNSPQSITDTTSQTIVEPNLFLTNTVDPMTVEGGDTATFTLIVQNPISTTVTRAWEPVITDTLPAEYETPSIMSVIHSQFGALPSSGTFVGNKLTVDPSNDLASNDNHLDPGQTITVTYAASVIPSLKEAQIDNIATVRATSLLGVSGTPGAAGSSTGERTGTGIGENDLLVSVTTTLTLVNDAPVATNDMYTATEDMPLLITVTSVISNDIDIENDPLTVTVDSDVNHGTLNLNPNGSFTYTPSFNFNGNDFFSYILSDGVLTDTATVSLTITPVNDAPIATVDAFTTAENHPILIAAPGVTGNDLDYDADPLTVTLESDVSHGTLTLSPSGSFVYTPSLHFNGSDFFSYILSDGVLTDTATVSLTITSINDTPVATNDMYTATEDMPLLITVTSVISNDIDIENDPLTVTVDSDVNHGTLNLNPNGSFTYTPSFNFNGNDFFSYILSDGVLTDTATVSLTITPVNDAPIATVDAFTTAENHPILIAAPGVTGNDLDYDADPLTVTLESDVSHGTLTLSPSGSFVYTPSLHFNGSDFFSYILSDGVLTDTATVSLTITSINDTPVATDDAFILTEDLPLQIVATTIISNDIDIENDRLSVIVDSDVSNGTLTLSPSGSFVYTPSLNFNGSDYFTYILSDGVLTDTATVSLTIIPVNDAPVATNDTFTTAENHPLIIAVPGVIDNDIDYDADRLTVTVSSGVSNGTLILNPSGSFVYTPSLHFEGDDFFTYILSDGVLTDKATVTITVTSMDQILFLPVVVSGYYLLVPPEQQEPQRSLAH